MQTNYNVEPEVTAELLGELTQGAVDELNALTRELFRTRDGRIGSGMGLLLESLWGYYINRKLHDLNEPFEIGWIASHQYNDFACLLKDVEWHPVHKQGEVLRIEIKSMIAAADEPKAHFDELEAALGPHDLLVVLLWDWLPIDQYRIMPKVTDYFCGNAKNIARLRDALHIARGGSFVDSRQCPDGCSLQQCTHHQEPLNAAGKRERLSGPNATKPANVSFANNFGGLVRMLKTRNADARTILRDARNVTEDADKYIQFIYRNYQTAELNHYSKATWLKVAEACNLDQPQRSSAAEIQRRLIESGVDYQHLLNT